VTRQRPRPIEPTDRSKSFNSGEPSLDQYLSDRALANHVAGFARCYVCVDEATGQILGYYTLSTVSLERNELGGRGRRNAPNPVPAVLLGRLAVDHEAQGSGLGRQLVRDALLSTLAAAERVGIRVLLVHAVNDSAARFYLKLGFMPSPTDPLHLYVLLADAREPAAG
jgi:predicted N-acetyltransferase YhbS